MKDTTFLLYGATGYTGRLIAGMAEKFGLTPILAGRNEEVLKELAAETGYRTLAFSLEDRDALIAALEEVSVVLHAAGPFQYTSAPMVEACIASRTHYVDITGEIGVFESLKKMDGKAKEAGVVLMPGSGFDVVPTDCMARFLYDHMPDGELLQLAFWQRGSTMSRGTARTAIESLGEHSVTREGGKLKKVPVGHKTMWIPFTAEKKAFAMTIPWGDLSTAHFTTGIPNIETYMAIQPKMHQMIRFTRFLNPLLRQGWVKKLLLRRVENQQPGPDEQQLEEGKSYVWGRIQNPAGETLEARLFCPEGYWLTAVTSLLITDKLLQGLPLTGFQTPAAAFGADFVLSVPGTSREWVDQ